MSSTFHTAQAKIRLSSEFDLHRFVDRMKEKCIIDDNFIKDQYGVFNDELDCNFYYYLSVEEGHLILTVDTSSVSNTDTEVFEWLVDRATEYTGAHATMVWTTEDTRDGVSTASYTVINGDDVPHDEMVRDYKEMNKIASLLSGSEWNSDTIAEIAEIIRGTGRSVDDVA